MPDAEPLKQLSAAAVNLAVRQCERERAGPVYWAAATDEAARVSGAAGLGMS